MYWEHSPLCVIGAAGNIFSACYLYFCFVYGGGFLNYVECCLFFIVVKFNSLLHVCLDFESFLK